MKNDIDSYFMQPIKVDTVGNIYPIKLKDYEHFRNIANRYLMCGSKWLINILKLPKDICPLDYFVNIAYTILHLESNLKEVANCEDVNEIKKQIDILRANGMDFSIKDIEEMFEMTLHKKVTFYPMGDVGNNFDYSFGIENTGYLINRDNFEIYRETVMEQNLIYEPLTSPQKIGNDIIAKAIESLNKNGIETNITSILSSVKMFAGIGDDELKEYTYYRLMMDFETVNRINNNIINAIFRSVGNDQCDISPLAEKIDMDKNPYKGILQKHKASNIDKKMKMG